MKIIELVLDEEQEESGIEAISIVENPAIESDFVALKTEEIKLAEINAEKKILLGALLIPNKPIYRSGDDGEYYIFFSKETVAKASQMYLRNGYQNKSTLEHDKALNGLPLQLPDVVVTSESHHATAPRLLSLMQLACFAPKLCASSCTRTAAASSTV